MGRIVRRRGLKNPCLLPQSWCLRTSLRLINLRFRIGHLQHGMERVGMYSSVAYGTGHGFTFQMSLAYSPIVRSAENFPERATFKIALRAQPSGSA
jgi:hypothetical protein